MLTLTGRGEISFAPYHNQKKWKEDYIYEITKTTLLAAALAVSAIPMVPRVYAAEPVSTAARAEIPLQTASGRDSAHVSELDGTWKFGGQNLSDKKALSADYSSWSDVTIPHTWNATDG